MKKLLLANGCSFTYGYEMNDAGSLEEARYNPEIDRSSKHAWPQLLGKKLNMTVRNISLPGCGNDTIYRSTVKTVLELLKDGIEPSDILAGIQFTFNDRMEYPYDEYSWKSSLGKDYNRAVKDANCNYRGFWHPFGAGNSKITEDKANQGFLNIMILNDYYRFYNTLNSVFSLQQFLHNKGIDYFMLLNTGYVFEEILEEDSLSYFFENIDYTKFFFFDNPERKHYSIYNVARRIPLPTGKNGHYLNETHELLANSLHSWLQDHKYF